jgi:D-serine deaminase-like pyridoxal phosphate-dependent protein
VALARAIAEAGLEFRGLHGYDGHAGGLPAETAEASIHRGYDALISAATAVRAAGLDVGEVITAGTPAFPMTLSYRGFADAGLTHRVSPGTVVYCDTTAIPELPPSAGYRPAAIVLTTVISQPRPGRVTCDAGHKSVSADAGVPTCAVVGREDLKPGKPSEEHLPIDVPEGASPPALGERLFLVPRHVCPTVNNFDHALVVERGRLVSVERVTARGREAPWGGTIGSSEVVSRE